MQMYDRQKQTKDSRNQDNLGYSGIVWRQFKVYAQALALYQSPTLLGFPRIFYIRIKAIARSQNTQ